MRALFKNLNIRYKHNFYQKYTIKQTNVLKQKTHVYFALIVSANKNINYP